MNLRPIPEHGTDSRYSNQKCRCELCRRAHREYQCQWYRRQMEDPEKRARKTAYQRAHQKANPERWRAWYKDYRDRHHDERLESYRAYYAANREQRLAFNKRYLAANPDVYRQNAARRRARLRGNETEPYRRSDIFDRDQGRCHICGDLVDPGRWDIDHILPIAQGGPDTPANVAVSHPRCNLRKGDRVA